MKTLKITIVLIGFMFSFNNQIFAIECDITKFTGIIKEVAVTQFKDEAKLEELAGYSVCGAPVKTIYEKIKTSWKALVDLEKYEKKSSSKVAQKTKSDGETKDLAIEVECENLRFLKLYGIVGDSEFKNKEAFIQLLKYDSCEDEQIKSLLEMTIKLATHAGIDVENLKNQEVKTKTGFVCDETEVIILFQKTICKKFFIFKESLIYWM